MSNEIIPKEIAEMLAELEDLEIKVRKMQADTIQNLKQPRWETQEPTELEKAAWEGVDSCGSESCDQEKIDLFIAGAKWLGNSIKGYRYNIKMVDNWGNSWDLETEFEKYLYEKIDELTKTSK